MTGISHIRLLMSIGVQQNFCATSLTIFILNSISIDNNNKGSAMSKIYKDNSESIGNTPLVRLNHVTQGAQASVLAKIEGRNPS